MSVLTGCPLASDLPKLPCRTPVSQVQYWSTAGRFRPSCTSSACRRCGVAVFSSTALAALPGSVCVAANTRIDTSTSVRIPIRLRLISRSRIGMRPGGLGRWADAFGCLSRGCHDSHTPLKS